MNLKHTSRFVLCLLLLVFGASVFSARSSAAFTPANTISGDVSLGFAPAGAANARGDVAIVWKGRKAGEMNNRVYIVIRRAGSKSFEAPVVLSDPAVTLGVSDPFDPLAVDVGPNGHIAAAWTQTAGANKQVAVATFQPGSTNPVQAVVDSRSGATDQSATPSIAVDAQGEVGVVYERGDSVNKQIFSSLGSASSGLFGASVSLSTGMERGLDPSIATNAAGRMTAVWQGPDRVNTNFSNDTRIHQKVRPAGGVFAGGAVNSDIVSTGASNLRVFAPKVDVNESGDTVVGWYRLAVGSTIEAALRPAGSNIYSAPQVLSEAGAGVSARNPQVAISNSGRALAAWPQSAGVGGVFSAMTPNGPLTSATVFNTAQSANPPGTNVTVRNDLLSVNINRDGLPLVAWPQSEAAALENRPVAALGSVDALGEVSEIPGSKVSNDVIAVAGAPDEEIVAWFQQEDQSTVLKVVGFDKEPPVFGTTNIPETAVVDEPVSMSASASDKKSSPVKVTWSFSDDSAAAEGSNVVHTYKKPGTYTVKVLAVDAVGFSTTNEKTIVVQKKQAIPLQVALSKLTVRRDARSSRKLLVEGKLSSTQASGTVTLTTTLLVKQKGRKAKKRQVIINAKVKNGVWKSTLRLPKGAKRPTRLTVTISYADPSASFAAFKKKITVKVGKAIKKKKKKK